jgi:LysR family transcriptional regulator, benzoate and cis,cis-muconate-responsive activator of ben and cat genes
MDIRQLRYFTAVAEELNFTRAAERLHISQPPLTRQIQALEESLGVALFLRKPQGAQLTEAGKTLLDDARNLASLMEQSVERAQLAGRGDVGRLDVGFFGTAAFDVLPRVLAAYRQAHPRVKLVLHPGQTPAQVVALRQGRVAVVFERQVPRDPDIDVEVAAKEKVFVALPSGHRLAQRKLLDVEDLRDEPMILPEGLPPQMSGMAVKVFRSHGLVLKEGPRCLDMTSGTILVACGAGLFLVPASMAVVAIPGVVYRPLRSRRQEEFDLYCFYLREHASPLLEGLLHVMRSVRDTAPGAASKVGASGRRRSLPVRAHG